MNRQMMLFQNVFYLGSLSCFRDFTASDSVIHPELLYIRDLLVRSHRSCEGLDPKTKVTVWRSR